MNYHISLKILIVYKYTTILHLLQTTKVRASTFPFQQNESTTYHVQDLGNMDFKNKHAEYMLILRPYTVFCSFIDYLYSKLMNSIEVKKNWDLKFYNGY